VHLCSSLVCHESLQCKTTWTHSFTWTHSLWCFEQRGDTAKAKWQYEKILGKALLGRGPAEHWAHSEYAWIAFNDGDTQVCGLLWLSNEQARVFRRYASQVALDMRRTRAQL